MAKLPLMFKQVKNKDGKTEIRCRWWYAFYIGFKSALDACWQEQNEAHFKTENEIKEQSNMANLKDLVPPLELCKLIPKGEFKDTYFSYTWFSFEERYEVVKTEWLANQKNSYPAPTLQEILEKFSIWILRSEDNEQQGSCIDVLKEDFEVFKNSPSNFYAVPKTAEEALELWLKLKGIKTNENE